MRTVLLACCVAAASAYAPAGLAPSRRTRVSTTAMSAAALAPSAPSPIEAAIEQLGALVDGALDELEQFELPRVLMAIPGRTGPSNKARAGVSGFRARKLTKSGQRVLRNRRKKGRKAIVPSPGRHPIHGL